MVDLISPCSGFMGIGNFDVGVGRRQRQAWQRDVDGTSWVNGFSDRASFAGVAFEGDRVVS